MRRSVFNLSILMLLAFSLIASCPAQQATQTDPPKFPIVSGSKTDGLPQKLIVRGTITQVSYSPPHCGELIFAATFEIKLDGKLSSYDHPYLYVVVPCLYQPDGAEKFLNRHVAIAVTKQEEKRQPCFFDVESNRINSNGLPFYCAEREELLKAVANIPNPSSPIVFEGWLKEGNTYRALVAYDLDQEWRTVVPLRLPFHHAARIEWLNLKDFPRLNKPESGVYQKQFVFEVVEQKTGKVEGQDRWNTIYYCRIIVVG
jgi:hypothetical protein